MTKIHFPDRIPALKLVWLLGDQFLRETFGAYQAWRLQCVKDQKPVPYLFDNYEVQAKHPECWLNVRSFLARVVNVLVNALNKPNEFQLPRYLLIVLDKDLLVEANFPEYRISRAIEDVLKWFLINLNLIIETAKKI